ncbi:protein tyrosine phosphatase family protein [Shewanella electrodiphila]|uniref:Protein tyrosine phosphatase family protein n=1 Tax=Shewanella electrodiphila TaxID=934143 RepID=A0ABT0KRP5_9GAMM|nr:protein tyrosine phosphatase family protein [Shewanella electrodiphila]MCL1046531.1 protein tyrosine phosphatase family protein [Shewanella electrodiphila]
MNSLINDKATSGKPLKHRTKGAIAMTMMITALALVNPVAAEINPAQLADIKAIKINNNQVITAGLPTSSEFETLKQAGVEVVINLIPTNNPNFLAEEPELVNDSGMKYENIEVDWQQPTIENVELFFSVMEQNNDKSILVHCAANYRASAFYYLYLATQGIDVSGEVLEDTLSPWGDLQQSFEKYPQWQALIEQVKQKYSTK